MACETPSQPHSRQGRPWFARFARWRLPRSAWVYLLIAAGLLAASEIVWVWHSWPVREILDSERALLGPTV